MTFTYLMHDIFKESKFLHLPSLFSSGLIAYILSKLNSPGKTKSIKKENKTDYIYNNTTCCSGYIYVPFKDSNQRKGYLVMYKNKIVATINN